MTSPLSAGAVQSIFISDPANAVNVGALGWSGTPKVVADSSLDVVPYPPVFVALTRYVYSVTADNPVSVNVTALTPV